MASMNRTGKVTAKKGPYDEYNAFKKFFDRETEAHIIAAWMEFTGMQELNGKNSPSLVTCRIKNWERRKIERGGGG